MGAERAGAGLRSLTRRESWVLRSLERARRRHISTLRLVAEGDVLRCDSFHGPVRCVRDAADGWHVGWGGQDERGNSRRWSWGT